MRSPLLVARSSARGRSFGSARGWEMLQAEAAHLGAQAKRGRVPLARANMLTRVNLSSRRGASSTAGFGAVMLGNGKKSRVQAGGAAGRLRACLGQISARNG